MAVQITRAPGESGWRSQPWAIGVRSKGGRSGLVHGGGLGAPEGCLCGLAGPVSILALELGGRPPALRRCRSYDRKIRDVSADSMATADSLIVCGGKEWEAFI